MAKLSNIFSSNSGQEKAHSGKAPAEQAQGGKAPSWFAKGGQNPAEKAQARPAAVAAPTAPFLSGSRSVKSTMSAEQQLDLSDNTGLRGLDGGL